MIEEPCRNKFIPVIICLFSNTRESSREFLTAANLQGMSVNEFAYIIPWLQVIWRFFWIDFVFLRIIEKVNFFKKKKYESRRCIGFKDGSKDVSPWIGSDGTVLQKVKDQYANAIIVSLLLKLMNYLRRSIRSRTSTDMDV